MVSFLADEVLEVYEVYFFFEIGLYYKVYGIGW